MTLYIILKNLSSIFSLHEISILKFYIIVLITSIAAEKAAIIPNRGSTNFSHLSKVTSAISRNTRIIPVGVIKDIRPCPQLYALIIISLETPAVSASGAIIGIESTASPEED